MASRITPLKVTRSQLVQAGPAALTAAALAACDALRGRPGGAPKGPVTISVLTRAGPAGHTGWYKDVTPRVFQAQHPTMTVEWDEAAGTTTTEKLIAYGASGTLPDVSWFGVISDGGRGGMFRGFFAPLDPLIKADRFDKGVYWGAALDPMSMKGQLYGLPTQGHFGPVVAYVNTELMKRAGVQVPLADGNWTLDQMLEMARRVTRLGEGMAGFWPDLSANEEIVVYTRTFGGDILSADGRRCQLDRPESIAALEWLWATQYRFQVVENLRGQGGALGSFQQGKVGIIIQGTGRIADWKGPQRGRVGFEWAATVMPRHASGRRGSQLATAGMGITSGAKQPAAGWEWIKFITNKDNGVNQVQGGGGSPGARNDVWTDPRLRALDPVYTLVQKTHKTPAALHLPHNETYFEVLGAVNGRLRGLWENTVSPNEAAQQACREVQALLDRPA